METVFRRLKTLASNAEQPENVFEDHQNTKNNMLMT